jgi:hypothetical protein
MEYDICNVFLLSFCTFHFNARLHYKFNLHYLELGSGLTGTNEFFFKVFGGIYVSAKEPQVCGHCIVTLFVVCLDGIRMRHFCVCAFFFRS